MRHTDIHIRNFRGISEVNLDLRAHPRSNIFTLVGLNESGKTTILEAISFFNQKPNLDSLDVPGVAARNVHDLIPISKRSNFNDHISVRLGYECDESDELAIKAAVQKELGIILTKAIGTFTVERSYSFKNSVAQSAQPRRVWVITLEGKKKSQRVSRVLNSHSEEWKPIIGLIAERLPAVLYFPNFLFELPDRIYLQPVATDAEKHAYYRDVLQDVLDALGEHTNLEEHVLARAKEGTPHLRQSMESVLLKMGAHITKTVFSRWDQIFQRPPGQKEIQVKIEEDPNGWYLQLRLKDGSDLYAISERSLGFRWFFAFLLLTEYRGFRKNAPPGALFLFDEPASNLHPSAQAQLLSSFGRFPAHATLVYTTHSHHMVNPDWLEGTYVVKNEGVDYSRADDYTARETLVTLHKYRTFAAAHPNQATYFQPVLDVLAYQPSKLENVPEVVMVEGKNDFYTLRLMQTLLGGTGPHYLLPGTGAGSLSDPIRLYTAWGRDFVVLLDSDPEGRKQRSRYEDVFGSLVRGRVICLADIDAGWSGRGMETMFEQVDLIAIQSAAYPEEKRYKKKLFNRAVQEVLVTKRSVSLTADTRDRFRRLLDELAVRLRS